MALLLTVPIGIVGLAMWYEQSGATWTAANLLWRVPIAMLPLVFLSIHYRKCWCNLLWQSITEGYVLEDDTVSKRHWGDNVKGSVLLFEHALPLKKVAIADVTPSWITLRERKGWFAKKLNIFGVHFASEASWRSFLLSLQEREIEMKCEGDVPPERDRVIREHVAQKKEGNKA